MTVMTSGMMAASTRPASRKAAYRRTGVVPILVSSTRAMRFARLHLSMSTPSSIPHMLSHGMGAVQPTKAISGEATPVMM